MLITMNSWYDQSELDRIMRRSTPLLSIETFFGMQDRQG